MTPSYSKKYNATPQAADLRKSSKPIYIGGYVTKCQHSHKSSESNVHMCKTQPVLCSNVLSDSHKGDQCKGVSYSITFILILKT